MPPERRSHARRILYSPEYLDMGAENGGMVANLSEGGLGFQSVSPIAPPAEIPISFSLGTAYRIDVKARVVWVNETGKVGGAVFDKLSKDSQSLICEWLTKAQVEHEVDGVDPSLDAIAELERSTVADAAAFKVAENGQSVAPRPSDTTEPLRDPSLQDAALSASRQPTREPFRPSGEPTRQNAPAPNLQRSAGPVSQATEKSHGSHSGTSFSAAPSISAWRRKDASAPAADSARKNAGPLFPPGRGENLFARPSSRFEPERERKGSGKLVVLAIVVAAAAVGAFYVRTHRQQVGATIADIGNKVAGKPDSSANASPNPAIPPSLAGGVPKTASTPPASPPVSPTQNSSAKAQSSIPATASSSAAKQITNPATNSGPPVSAAGSSASPAEPSNPKSNSSNAAPQTLVTLPSTQGRKNAPKSVHSATASDSTLLVGQSEYQRAEQYLNGRGVSQDYGEAAQWFWRSLEAGYTNAALPLANLYLEGNGVSRSCMQARILLDAAAQKNNAQAIQELAQLPENCQ